LNRVVVDLYAMGLTTTNSTQGMMTASGLLERRSTELGRSFWRFSAIPRRSQFPDASVTRISQKQVKEAPGFQGIGIRMARESGHDSGGDLNIVPAAKVPNSARNS
jgi:hypothetical protein